MSSQEVWVKTDVKFSLPEERQQQRNEYEVRASSPSDALHEAPEELI